MKPVESTYEILALKSLNKSIDEKWIVWAINDKKELLSTLNILNGIYQELDYREDYHDFFLLYWAKDDLNYSENQWYWEGAYRNNIDKIILDYFKAWKEKYE
ncbi:MAG: hypothetical protein Q8941_09685 [Bacteroidota bacterium]|nr:hypothetical protein [Bacteroidota bacterium]